MDDFDRAYDITRQALADLLPEVPVKHINHMHGGNINYNDPLAVIASFPAAYTVEVICLGHGANVMRYGRFGFSESRRLIEFPTSLDSEGAAGRLAETLVPYVRDELAAAAADRASYTGGGPVESRDAIREVTRND